MSQKSLKHESAEEYYEEDEQPTQKIIRPESGVILLMGPISSNNIITPIEIILNANLSPELNIKFITLLINSPGGSLHDAFALIDVMQGSQIPIHTVGIGLIASAGLLIFMSGAKGHRTLTPNTSILSHQWQGGMIGKSHELLTAQRNFSLMNDKVYSLYKKNTSLDAEKINEVLLPPNDVWLSAEEALSYGICDKITDCSTNNFINVLDK